MIVCKAPVILDQVADSSDGGVIVIGNKRCCWLEIAVRRSVPLRGRPRMEPDQVHPQP